MNTVQHYVIEIEEVLPTEEEIARYAARGITDIVRIKGRANCYGNISDFEFYCTRTEYEDILERGYFYG